MKSNRIKNEKNSTPVVETVSHLTEAEKEAFLKWREEKKYTGGKPVDDYEG